MAPNVTPSAVTTTNNDSFKQVVLVRVTDNHTDEYQCKLALIGITPTVMRIIRSLATEGNQQIGELRAWQRKVCFLNTWEIMEETPGIAPDFIDRVLLEAQANLAPEKPYMLLSEELRALLDSEDAETLKTLDNYELWLDNEPSGLRINVLHGRFRFFGQAVDVMGNYVATLTTDWIDISTFDGIPSAVLV